MPRSELVYLIDPDAQSRESLSRSLNKHGFQCCALSSGASFFGCFQEDAPSCLLLEMNQAPGNGIELQEELIGRKVGTPVVFISATADLALSVRAMKLGAVDVLLKPLDETMLFTAIEDALEKDARRKSRLQTFQELQRRFEALTHREREVLPFVIGGFLNKQSAAILGIAEVTLQVHRAQIMRKTKAQSLPDLVRMSSRLGIRHSIQNVPTANGYDVSSHERHHIRTVA